LADRVLRPDFACAQSELCFAESLVAPGQPMRNKRTRAFWMTFLVYALAGPLVGLLCLLVISALIEAWGPITDRLGALISHLHSSPCASPYSEHFDLRCFQQPPDPRQFKYPWLDLQRLSLGVFGAYVIGFIPASLAGLVICVGRLGDGGVGFSYAVVVGTLIGLMTGGVAMYKLENAILLFLICLIATIVCWFITRRWWRKAEVADTNSAR